MKINGKPVFDATKKITLLIKPDDIKKGANKDPGHCAAAEACLRQIKGIEQARVHIGRTYLNIKGKWMRYQTPESLRGEIIAFDRGGAFEPGEYTLNPMAPAHRKQHNRHKDLKRKSERRGGKRMSPHVVTGVRAYGANR